MAQQMTMFSKTATATFVARPAQVQRRSAVAVRAGPYDAELLVTAVSGGNARAAAAHLAAHMPAYPGGGMSVLGAYAPGSLVHLRANCLCATP